MRVKKNRTNNQMFIVMKNQICKQLKTGLRRRSFSDGFSGTRLTGRCTLCAWQQRGKSWWAAERLAATAQVPRKFSVGGETVYTFMGRDYLCNGDVSPTHRGQRACSFRLTTRPENSYVLTA